MSNGRQHRLALPRGYKLLWYEIVSILGQGGFGITYLARDTNLDQQVAIKEFLPTDLAVRTHDSSVQPLSDGHTDTYGWGLSRFVSEAKTLAKFRHPNVVLVHTVFEANGTAYMVMEYVRGRTLEDALKFGAVEGEAGLKEIMYAILDGLELIHQHGFIHRDIKPENIYLREDGRPVLLDFGSARQAIGAQTRTLTALVSPGYAPYEQYDSSRQSEGKQGPWTDIYALGATLYRAVTGHGPPDSMQRMSGVVDGRDIYQPAVVVAGGRYSDSFLRAIDWALQFKPENRPRRIEDWRQALSGTLEPDAATEVRIPPAPARTDRSSATTTPLAETPVRREYDDAPKKRSAWPGIGAAALVLALLAGGGWWYATTGGAPTRGPEPAQEPQVRADETASGQGAVGEAKSESTAVPAPAPEPAQAGGSAETQGPQQAQGANLNDETGKLLALADADFAAGRIIEPPGENALERYVAVLKMDPGNAAASRGKGRVFTHFIEQATALTEAEKFSDADAALMRADAVEPGTAAVRLARVRLNEAKREAESRALAERQKREQEAREEKARTAAEQKRSEQINAMLAAAEGDIRALRLTSPAGNNAYERYRSVLALDPDNAEAQNGMVEIARRYLELKDRAVEQKDFRAAEEYLEKAGTVLPDSELTELARKQLAEVRARHDAEQEQKRAEEASRREEQRKAEEQARLAAVAPSPSVSSAGAAREPARRVAPAGKATLALFPPAQYLGAAENLDADSDMRRKIFPLIDELAGEQLVYSYLTPANRLSASGEQPGLWSGPEAAQVPNVSGVQKLASRVGADFVLMYFFRSVGGGRYITAYDTDVFLVKVRSGDVRKVMGNNDNVVSQTRSLLQSLEPSQTSASASIQVESRAPAPVAVKISDREDKYMRCETGAGEVFEIVESDGSWRSLLNGQNVPMQIDFKTGAVGESFGYEDCIGRVYVGNETMDRFTVNFSRPTSRNSLLYDATRNSKCAISRKFADMGLCRGRIVSR
ncbi:MAG: protein kinase [Gammaproteobacteria bacterium]|nr:protein kinase [Gammaproteobacteria bacterium]